MADGRRLAFEDARKLGVTCKVRRSTQIGRRDLPVSCHVLSPSFRPLQLASSGCDAGGRGHCQERQPVGEGLTRMLRCTH